MRQYEKDGLEARAKERERRIDWFEVSMYFFVGLWTIVLMTVL